MHPRVTRIVRAAALAAALLPAAVIAGAQKPSGAPARRPPAVPGAREPKAPARTDSARAPAFGVARGVAVDSVHGGAPLVGAIVRVNGTKREGRTNAYGEFLIDSIEPGTHTLSLLHPLLDTIGVAINSAAQPFLAGTQTIVDLAVPAPATLVVGLCPDVLRARGPAALIGFVREADTEAPAEGAKVSLLWFELDVLKARQIPRVREAAVTEDGRYRLCGLPPDMSGRLQVIANGVSSGEVPVEVKDGLLALRSMSIAGTHSVASAQPAADTTPRAANAGGARPAAAPSVAAPPTRPAAPAGRARLTGRVMTVSGTPIGNARINVQGSGVATLTREDGQFSLDGLVPGTQTIEVRRLGYTPQEVAVELSSREPAKVSVIMADYVPTLATMRVTAQRDRGLSDVGFTMRKRSGQGYYLEGDEIQKRAAIHFSEVLRTIPGLRVTGTPGGSDFVVESTRNAANGCVNYVVDGSPWSSMFPGDLDQYVRPDEVAAVEVYNGAGTPAQFQKAGQGECATIVIWTVRRIVKKDRN